MPTDFKSIVSIKRVSSKISGNKPNKCYEQSCIVFLKKMYRYRWDVASGNYMLEDTDYILKPEICRNSKMLYTLYSLRTEICRTLRIWVGCTHARTTQNQHNSFLWSPQKAIFKVASRKIGRNFFPILCIRCTEKHEFLVHFSPLE